MEYVFELLKITIPALTVFLTVYVLLREFLSKQYEKSVLDFKQAQMKTTLPLRLGAYERLSMLCERISLPNLIMRLRTQESTVETLQYALMMAVQQEFEHNITQQVYVSENLWAIIKIAKEDTLGCVNEAAQSLDPKAPSAELITSLIKVMSGLVQPLDQALVAIKNEASILY
jgi:hypothetical protein